AGSVCRPHHKSRCDLRAGEPVTPAAGQSFVTVVNRQAVAVFQSVRRAVRLDLDCEKLTMRGPATALPPSAVFGFSSVITGAIAVLLLLSAKCSPHHNTVTHLITTHHRSHHDRSAGGLAGHFALQQHYVLAGLDQPPRSRPVDGEGQLLLQPGFL